MRHPHPLQRFVDPVLRGGLARGRQHHEVLTPGQVTVESGFVDDGAHARQRHVSMARNWLAEKRHGARVGVRQAEEDPDERRLAGTVRAEIAERATPRNEELNVVHGDVVAESFRQPVRLNGPRALRRVRRSLTFEHCCTHHCLP